MLPGTAVPFFPSNTHTPEVHVLADDLLREAPPQHVLHCGCLARRYQVLVHTVLQAQVWKGCGAACNGERRAWQVSGGTM